VNLDTLKTLLELGWPGIVTAFLCVMAWRYYVDTRDEISYLRQRIGVLEVKVVELQKDSTKVPS
jgi:hypothetical protein